MVNLLKIKQIWHMLTREACQTIVFGMVLSHLDDSNAISANLLNNAISKMQRVQNIASHIVLYDEPDLAQWSAFKNYTGYWYDSGYRSWHWYIVVLTSKYQTISAIY